MRPCLSLIILLHLPFLPVFSQITGTDTLFDAPVQILVPDSEYPVIDGRLAPDGENTYYVSPVMSLPGKSAPDKIIKKNNSPVFIEKNSNKLKSTAGLSNEAKFYRFLEDTESETGLNSPLDDFSITGVHTDKLGITHVRAVQLYKGIEIYGSESVLHMDDNKERFTGSIHHPSDNLQVLPAIDSARAVEISMNDLTKITSCYVLSPGQLKLLNYKGPQSKLILSEKHDGGLVLTWLITIRPNFREEWKYFIDAVNGSIIRKYNNTQYDGSVTGNGTDLNNMTRTFNVYLSSGIYYMYDITQKMFNPGTNEGIIITLDANHTPTTSLDYTYVTSVDNSWSQQAAISAHCNATRTYQYFDTTFNLNSINGKGCNIISLVNVAQDDGSEMDNAFWNGQAIFYGNGGEHFRSLAGALDVTAHELTHGVVSSTAGLEYYGQSGAINESFADIFACMVDSFDWTIGEDITREEYAPSGVMRDLSNPHNLGDSTNDYWQPAHVSEMYFGDEDNAGVHINSGICNYAFYLFATSIGKQKAAQIYYRALSEYLTKTSEFVDLRIAVMQATRDLYGDGSGEYYEAGHAFESVGIYNEQPVKVISEYVHNPGEQMLLTYDTSTDDPVTLYQSTAQGTNYRPMTRTPMTGKVSVTDDGSTAVFVSSEKRLRMINTNSADIYERIISGFSSYDRVAVSKDGNRLAATRSIPDGSIFVIDLVSGQGRQFLLYNPTTGDVGAGGVIKAYSIDFDITGQYLIYGAFNVINSNSQKDIYYWDIGIIRVWDAHNEQFGNGLVSKLYSTLPAHVNVANPVFSKNLPNIIAFDYFYDDGILEEYSIYTANLETGETGRIAHNDRLGYPTFSTNDDRIAYSTINGLNTQVVKSVRLSGNKLSPDDEPGVLVPDAKWPVFFTTGKRPLGLPAVSNFTVDYKYGDFPLTSKFIDISFNEPDSWQWLFEGGNPAASDEKNPLVLYENPGFYKVTLISCNAFGSDTLVREKYIHVIDPVAVSANDANSWNVYPNPAHDLLYISSCSDHYSITIFNSEGERIFAAINPKQVNISKLSPGLYIFEFETENSRYRRKLVKQ